MHLFYRLWAQVQKSFDKILIIQVFSTDNGISHVGINAVRGIECGLKGVSRHPTGGPVLTEGTLCGQDDVRPLLCGLDGGPDPGNTGSDDQDVGFIISSHLRSTLCSGMASIFVMTP